MVSIRVDGNLPSTCYSDPTVRTVVSANSIVISLDSVMSFGPCSLVLVPFSKTVVVGPLAPGTYTVSATLSGLAFFRFAPVVFSVPADVPAASLLTLLALGAGLVLLRYRLVRAG
jgi:hypothetical protein